MMFYLSWFSLFFAGLGQAVFFAPLTEHRLPEWLTGVIPQLPFLVVFTIHSRERPLFSFSTHHHIWLLALCWFAALTITAEVLRGLDLLPPRHPEVDIFPHIFMHLGWFSFIPFVHSYLIYGRTSKPN